MFEHTLLWHCPTCGRTERSVTMSKSREVEVDQRVCAGTLISHAVKDMYWTDHSVIETTTHGYAQGGYIPPLGSVSGGSKMTNPNPFGALDTLFDRSFLTDIARLHTPSPNSAAGKAAATREKAKAQAAVIEKIQEGDVIQLVAKAGAVMQGEVLAVRKSRGTGQNVSVRIKGFDHVGGAAGGHHVYWPLAEFDVEILVESYRLTDEDRAIAVVAGYSEDAFKMMSESRKADLRGRYATRLHRAKAILTGEGG